MSEQLKELSAADLGALLCSKICHDIISPVGAVTNGLELMDEDIDGSMREMAIDLVKRSATQASAKLKFARIAFGASGSAGAEIDTGDAEAVALEFIASEKPELEWTLPRCIMAKNRVKLALNLVMLSINCVPQGGKIKISSDEDADKISFTLVCSGIKARIPSNVSGIVMGEFSDQAIDAHNIQAYYTWLLAQMCEMDIKMSMKGEDVLVTAS